MSQKLITMTEKESERYDIIQDLINKKINGTDASKMIGVTVRQVKRIKLAVLKYGMKGVIHQNRGQIGNRKLDPAIIEKIEKHLKEKYYDFGPTFASEKLDENDGIKLGKETIRGIMTNLGLWKPKSRKQSKKWHTWRPRKDNYGEMEQFDGSYHIWFGNEETCLLLSVDDATGRITHAKFDINESTKAVFKFWLEYFDQNGLPISIYLDKYSTYKINHKNAVDNKDMLTQFQRAMNQVGVNPITAHSAEAKGRIERLFQTLQDRLVKELRLANITTIEEANKFLKEYIPKFNTKFSVIPKRKKNLHKKLNKQIKDRLPQIFSIQKKRVVMNDYTIRFENQYFQLNQEQPTTVYKKDTVMVEKHLDNDIKVNLKGHYLNYTILPERPQKEIDVKLLALTTKKQSDWKPPLNHPWRQQFFVSRQNTNKQYQLNNN